MDNGTLVLTSSALLTFLTEIEELKGIGIRLEESDDKFDITIGDNTYQLTSPEGSEVAVDDAVVDAIEDINEEGFDDLSENLEEEFGEGLEVIEEDNEPIEGGVIKELIKTLAVGGLVRLTKDAIINS